MEEAKRVSIHIVAWNHASLIPTTLESLDAQTDASFQVVVSDSASQDGLASWLKEHRPDVVLMRHFRHQGFSRSHNAALSLAFSRWPKELLHDRFVVFMDPDVVVAPDVLERLVRVMVGDPTLAVVGPKILAASSRFVEEEGQEVDYTDTLLSTGTMLAPTRAWRQRETGLSDGPDRGRDPVFAPPLGFLLVRASALLEAQIEEEWFDTGLSGEASLVDLLWRLRLLGGGMRVVPEVRAWRRAPLGGGAVGWFDRVKQWYSGKHLARRRFYFDRCVMRVKNDVALNRFYAFGWTLFDLGRALSQTLLDPRLFGEWIRWPGRVLRAHRLHPFIRSRIRVSAKEVRSWFI